MAASPDRAAAVPAVLDEVRIRDLGVIDDAVLPLASGLTVLTGETGAGKTMVVQGLTLLFGGRADAGRVRPGADRAVVEGRLRLSKDHPAVVRCEEAGAELDDGDLLVSRSVGADGRSRAHVGGRAVPIGLLAEVGDDVLAVHGQSDQHRLLSPARQRDALDRFGGAPVLDLRSRYAETWAALRELRTTLSELEAHRDERAREAERLRVGLAEVEALDPSPDEVGELGAEIERLSHADGLRTAAAVAQEALTGTDDGEGSDALQLVTAARRSLEGAAEHDPALGALAERAKEAALLVGDLAQDLGSYAAGVEADPVRLAAAHERLADLTTLARRLDVDDVLAWASQASTRLLSLDTTDDRIAALRAEQDALEAQLDSLGAALTLARTAAAERFGAAVTTELRELAMPNAEVSALVSPRDPGPEGADEVELVLMPHKGAPARPLQKGASGGELSRVMLAVEVVFAGADPVPVMVFDEVDAGVGGASAVEIGRRLARLARDHQVLVVTHLPQVAAFADTHLHVVKDDDGSAVTRGGVVELDDEARVVELSRMLAGTDTGRARAHAEELLAQARHAVRG